MNDNNNEFNIMKQIDNLLSSVDEQEKERVLKKRKKVSRKPRRVIKKVARKKQPIKIKLTVPQKKNKKKPVKNKLTIKDKSNVLQKKKKKKLRFRTNPKRNKRYTRKKNVWKEAKIEKTKLTKADKAEILKKVRKIIYIGLLTAGIGTVTVSGYKLGYKWGEQFSNDIKTIFEEREKEGKELFGEEYYNRMHPNLLEKEKENEGR